MEIPFQVSFKSMDPDFITKLQAEGFSIFQKKKKNSHLLTFLRWSIIENANIGYTSNIVTIAFAWDTFSLIRIRTYLIAQDHDWKFPLHL